MPITVTNPNNRPVVTAEATTDIGVSIGIDYTSYYDRIATALETIATQTTTIATQTTTIATQTTTVANTLIDIEAHQQKLRELGEGAGIHIVGPYEWLSMYSIYKLLLEQGVTDFASLKAQVNSLPKEF